MLSSETAGILMMVTLVISAVMMPMAYVAKHRWHDIRLTRTLSAAGVASMAAFMLLAYFYLPG